MTYKEFIESITPEERDIVNAYHGIFVQTAKELSAPVMNILEVGSGWGLFCRAAVEHTKANIITLDKIGGYGLKAFEKNAGEFVGSRIERIEADSHKFLATKEKKWAGKFDVVFVDGDHSLPGAQQDLKESWGMLKSGGTLLIDDVFHKCNWDQLEDKTFNFGVSVALWSFLQARLGTFYPPVLHTVGHGLVAITKA